MILAGRLSIGMSFIWMGLCFAIGARGETLRHQEEITAGAPNILIVTVDNLGYGDLRSFNPDSPIKTPELDRLASQGIRLTSFYTASPTCTVSRACLLTGRVPERHGLVGQLGGVAGNYGVGLKQSEVLIPQLLRTAPRPYATGCFGKWNIGFAEGSRPTERGFDEFIGHASGNIDYYRHNYRERHDLYQGIEEMHVEGQYSTDLFADSAISFIERMSEKEQPWFCYLAFNAPHFPSPGNRRDGEPNVWQAPDWAFAEYDIDPSEPDPKLRYSAVVTALDRAIGRVMKALDDSNVAEQTFVFFMSDNGSFQLGREGLDVGSNFPLRSGGVTCWEGGIRVPALVRWPGHIDAGGTVDSMHWSPDLFVACMTLANCEIPTDLILDGRNPLAALTENARSPHESLYFKYKQHAALRKGDWKLVRESPDEPWKLFDLSEDIQESNDLTQWFPEKLRELNHEFERWAVEFDR